MKYGVKIGLVRLLGYNVIENNVYPAFLDKNQPIGLESIKGYLEKNCRYPLEVRIIDFHQDIWQSDLEKVAINNRDEYEFELSVDLVAVMKKIFDKAKLAELDIIGLSAPVSSEKMLCYFLWHLTNNEECRGKIILVGNLVSTFCYDQIIEDYPSVFCCVGSGEKCLLALCDYIASKKERKEEMIDHIRTGLILDNITVPGLFFSYQGTLFHSRQLYEIEQNLSFLPSISTQEEVEARGGNMRVQSSRGCNFHCGFCVVNKVFGISARIEFAVDDVLAYIEKVVANSTQREVRIDFIDDEFLSHPVNFERMEFLFSGIRDISRDLGREITFSFATNSNSLQFSNNAKGERLKALWFMAKDSGLSKVFLGLESNALTQLNRYNKYGSPASNEQAITFLRDVLGIRMEVAMILVDYEMDANWRYELLENFDFLYRHGLHTERALLIQIIKPLRFSNIFLRYKAKGILLDQDGRYSPVWNAKFLNPEIEKFVRIFEGWSSKKEPLYQLRYRLKQDLPFGVQSEEERIKKKYKDGLAELDFFLFRELVERWGERDIEEVLNAKLIAKRKKILSEMKKDILAGRIAGYSDYYLTLLDTYFNFWS